MIVDNRPHKREELQKTLFSDQEWELLHNNLSHRTVGSLCNDIPDLLIFPHCLGDRRKEFCDAEICAIVGNTITTGNLMGFVGVEDGEHCAELTIRSRFQQDGKEDYFLHYLLEKVFHINLLKLPTSGGDNETFEFILFHLFTHYLRRSIKQGIFKQYQKSDYNDANVKGVIDIPRQIRYNIPFNGKVAYRTSEYKYDNPVTQLIRHTIEYIRQHPMAGNVLKEVDECVRTIYDITPSYNVNQRQSIINKNLKPIKHPFYTQYIFLQRLCLHILRHKKMSYAPSEQKVYGILFDGAWLWEEYLATMLVEKGFTHAVKEERNGFQMYAGGQMRYPDFYNVESGIILDAKYKRLNLGIQRNDLYQMISYIHTLNNGKDVYTPCAKLGALIYPLSSNDTSVGDQTFAFKTLYGAGGKLGVMSMQIPQGKEDYENFVGDMNDTEEKFVTSIHEIVRLTGEHQDDEIDINIVD